MNAPVPTMEKTKDIDSTPLGICQGLGQRNFEVLLQRDVRVHPQDLPFRIIRKRARGGQIRDRPWGLLDAQEDDAGDPNADVVRKLAGHAQPALGIRHLHVRRLGLRDADAVVDVQRAASRAVRARRDHQFKVLFAQVRRRHRALRAQREHHAAPDMERDLRVVHVRQRHVLSCTVDGLERREIVEAVLGEVDRD